MMEVRTNFKAFPFVHPVRFALIFKIDIHKLSLLREYNTLIIIYIAPSNNRVR
jgi:hypothetical protein